MSQYLTRRVPGLVQSNNVHHKDTNHLNNLSSNLKFCFDIKPLHTLLNSEPLWVQLLIALRRNLVSGALG